MKARIVFLPGDGIGREVLGEARRVLETVEQVYGHSFEIAEGEIGVTALKNAGDPSARSNPEALPHGGRRHVGRGGRSRRCGV